MAQDNSRDFEWENEDGPEGEEKPWDENQWEVFLQEQDRKSQQYEELMEKFADEPNRDELVAGEMGWSIPEQGVTYDTGHNFLSNEDEEIEGVIDFEDDEDEFEMLDDEEYEDEDEDEVPAFEDDPMYQSSFELGSWLIQLLSGKKKAISSQKSLADELETTIAVMGAKLAAGLDAMDEVEELGMSIALKSLKVGTYGHF